MTKDKDYIELKSFIHECKIVRESFIKEIRNQPFNVKLRVASEDIILMFDQLISYIEEN